VERKTYKTMGEAMSDPQSSLRKRLDKAAAERQAVTKNWTAEDWARYVRDARS
jgi:hypothetical protein